MSENVTTEELMNRVIGDWSGEEVMTLDPSQGGTMNTSASLSNTPGLGGLGYVSDYVQSHQGSETIRCITVFNFAGEGEFVAMWTPTEGTSQLYSGQRTGYLLSMSAKNPDGSTQTIETDYSHADQFSTRMLVTPPGGQAMKIFEGTYHRKTSNTGRQV